MTSSPRLHARSLRALRLSVPALAVALVVGGCSSSGDQATTPTASPTPSSTVDVPDGVHLTRPGSKLSFGESATVIDEPDQRHGSVLRLTVQRVRIGSIKDFGAFILDAQTRASTPYYAKVEVENLGESDLGGDPVPLWAVDDSNTLVQASRFTTPFATCPSQPLPKSFGQGDTFSTCLAYLAGDHGTVGAISFRPDQKVAPITWTGEVTTPKPRPTHHKKDSSKSGKHRSKRHRG